MKKECCVICHQETDIFEDTPIELRDNYVEGVGQLCPECVLKMEKEEKNQSTEESPRKNTL